MHCTNYYESAGFYLGGGGGGGGGGGLESLLPPSPLKDTQECMQDNSCLASTPPTPLHVLCRATISPPLEYETLEYMLKLGYNLHAPNLRTEQFKQQCHSKTPALSHKFFSSSGNEAKWCSIATGKNGNKNNYRHCLINAVSWTILTSLVSYWSRWMTQSGRLHWNLASCSVLE